MTMYHRQFRGTVDYIWYLSSLSLCLSLSLSLCVSLSLSSVSSSLWFMLTCVVIRRSDGLETTKVLDMVPLKSMLVTPGLPSMVSVYAYWYYLWFLFRCVFSLLFFIVFLFLLMRLCQPEVAGLNLSPIPYFLFECTGPWQWSYCSGMWALFWG